MTIATVMICATIIIICFVVCFTIENIKNNESDNDASYNELLCDVKHVYLGLIRLKNKLRYDNDSKEEAQRCAKILEPFVDVDFLEKEVEEENKL